MTLIKREAQARISELTGILTEALSVSGALLVRTFGRERAEPHRFRDSARELRRLAVAQSRAGRWFQILVGLFESIGPALVFAAGGSW